MGIFYREKALHAKKKIRKNDFAPSEKYSSYAPADNVASSVGHEVVALPQASHLGCVI